MQTLLDRQRLVNAMIAEPIRAWFILAKCATGLAVIVLIAVIGYDERADRMPTVAASAAANHADAAQEHRKQVFDDRRQRYRDVGPSRLADKANTASHRSPVTLR